MSGLPIRCVGDLVSVRGGGTPKRDVEAYFNGDIPWVTPKDMKSWEVHDAQIHITDEAVLNSATNVVPSDTVLLVVRSGVLKHTAPIAINRKPVAINQDMKSLQCGRDIIPEFLARFLKYMEPEILSWVRATTADNYPIDKIRNLKIRLPPLKEQRRIAAILDRADELRRKRRAARALSLQLTQSLFLQVFGDPIHNPMNFGVIRLGSLVDPKRGISYGIVQRGEDLNIGVPVLRISDISDEIIDPKALKQTSKAISNKYRRTILRGGEIVISIRGTVGRCCVVGSSLVGANVSREIAVIPYNFPDQSDFLINLIRTDAAQARLTRDVKGIAQSGINLEDLWELPVIQPPKTLVSDFLDLVQHHKLILTKCIASGSQFDCLFAALQHRAFNGEL